LNTVSRIGDIRDVVGTEAHVINAHQVCHVIDMAEKHVSGHDR